MVASPAGLPRLDAPTGSGKTGVFRRRVAIIGGGLSGLTAAYELSSTPALRETYEVTVYQTGWRLGGKLASGRNPKAGMRNEEHGLHVWFGFYDNAFRMAREVIDAWERPPDCPIHSLEDVLVPHAYTPVGLPVPAGYDVWDVQFRPNEAVAGDDPRVDPPALLLSRLGAVLRSNLSNFAGRSGRRPKPGFDRTRQRPGGVVARVLGGLSAAVVEGLAARARAVRGDPGHPDIVVARRWVRRVQRLLPWLDRVVIHRPGLLNARNALEFFAAFFLALTDSRYRILCDFDLDRVNHLEFREWLHRHGASRGLLEQWPLVRVPYDATFQYRGGDLDKPDFEAGTAARFFLRAYFGYRGAAAYLVGAGMGEALISPMYEVLKSRGVGFSFFHQLVSVDLDPAKRRAARLVFREQARSIGEYQPLQTFAGLRCWSTEPDWSQLHGGEALRASGVRFETDAALGELRELLDGQDFDEVILALPAGALRDEGARPSCVASIREVSPRLGAFARGVNLVPSVAAQLWCSPSMEGLGWTRPRAAMVSWALPYSIWADMSDVVELEGWGADGPRSSHYLCGSYGFDPLPPVGTPQHEVEANAQAVGALEAQLRQHAARLWPAARRRGGEFDWSVLHDPEDRSGPLRLQAQYVRANVAPSDLCDGAAVGTSALRPEAHETGLDNVVFAGTWTRTNVNSTCVEAATISGIAAARVLTGPRRTILSEAFMQRPRPVVCRPPGEQASVPAWRVG